MNPGVDEWDRQAGTQIKHFFGSRPVGKERDLLKEMLGRHSPCSLPI